MKKSTKTSTNKDSIKEQDPKLEKLNYPPSQDIMNKDQRVDIDPESLPGNQMPFTTPNNTAINKRPEQVEEDMGLDVPGAELDDKDEEIGSEDEENNYYSLSDNADEE